MTQKPGISLYWKCQLIGWAAASLYWGYTGYVGTGFSLVLAIIHFVMDMTMYIGLTHLFRNWSKRRGWHLLEPGPLVLRLIPSVLVLAGIYLVITIGKIFIVREIFETGFDIDFITLFRMNAMAVFVTGARLMAIWLLAYYLYHYSQRELKATRENARLAIIARDAQMDHLKSQLNPHFFFNSLNNIKSLVIENPESARRAIDLLSDLLRVSLYRSDAMLVALEEELALVKDYAELEKLRLEERLTVRYEIDEKLLQHQVLPLSIQSLVENAIKHGIAESKGGGEVSITVREVNGVLLTTVSNPGSVREINGNGIGLRNLKERLQLQFQDRAAFSLEEKNGMIIAEIKSPLIV